MARFKEFQLPGHRKPILINLDDISSLVADDAPGRTIVNFKNGKHITVVADYSTVARIVQGEN